jgi:hypothetical protein
MRRLFHAVFPVAVCLLAACSSSDSSPSAPETVTIETVLVSPAVDTLDVGQTRRLTAVARGANGTLISDTRPTEWRSLSLAVANVDATGTVTAVGPGTTTVFATIGGRVGSASLVVRTPPVTVASIVVSPPTSTVQVGGTVTLSASVRDRNGLVLTDRPVSWTSSNSAVAQVSAAGVVTALTTGTATITAARDGVNGAASVTVTSSALGRLELVTQPPTSAMTMSALSRAPVVRAILPNGQVASNGLAITATVEELSGAVFGGGTSSTSTTGLSTFDTMILGVGPNGFLGSTTVIRLRFAAAGFAPVISEVLSLQCFSRPISIDQPFTFSGTVQRGDCSIDGNRTKGFPITVPSRPAGNDNAIDMAVQLSSTNLSSQFPGFYIRGAGANESERLFISSGGSGAGAFRSRFMLAPGVHDFGVFGAPLTSSVASDFVVTTAVQPVDQASGCFTDFVYIPSQQDLQFSQTLSTTDCLIPSQQANTDRYGVLLNPGISVRVAVDALSTELPVLRAFLYPPGSANVNSANPVQIAVGSVVGRSASYTVTNTDAIARFYSISVSAPSMSMFGPYRMRVAFTRPN